MNETLTASRQIEAILQPLRHGTGGFCWNNSCCDDTQVAHHVASEDDTSIETGEKNDANVGEADEFCDSEDKESNEGDHEERYEGDRNGDNGLSAVPVPKDDTSIETGENNDANVGEADEFCDSEDQEGNEGDHEERYEGDRNGENGLLAVPVPENPAEVIWLFFFLR